MSFSTSFFELFSELNTELNGDTAVRDEVYLLINYVVRYTSTAAKSRSPHYFLNRYHEVLETAFAKAVYSCVRDLYVACTTSTAQVDVKVAFQAFSKVSYSAALANIQKPQESFLVSISTLLLHDESRIAKVIRNSDVNLLKIDSQILDEDWNPTDVDVRGKSQNIWQPNGALSLKIFLLVFFCFFTSHTIVAFETLIFFRLCHELEELNFHTNNLAFMILTKVSCLFFCKICTCYKCV